MHKTGTSIPHGGGQAENRDGPSRDQGIGAEGGTTSKSPGSLDGAGIQDKDDHIRKLESEVRLLQGKIKGYQTLGQLYQEARNDIGRKNNEIRQLQQQLTKAISLPVDHSGAVRENDPGGPGDRGATQQVTSPSTSGSSIEVVDIDPSQSSAVFQRSNSKQTIELEDPGGKHNLEISQNTSAFDKINPFPSVLTPVNLDKSQDIASTNLDHPQTCSIKELSGDLVSGELMIDSDRFDEKYQEMNAPSSNSSSSDSSLSGGGSSLALPSMESGESRSKSHHLTDMSSYSHLQSGEVSLHQGAPISTETAPRQRVSTRGAMLIGAGVNETENANLSMQVQEISHQLNQVHASTSVQDEENKSSQYAESLARISVEMVKMEAHLKTKDAFIDNLSSENESLKIKLAVTLPEKERALKQLQGDFEETHTKIRRLQTENELLLNKIKELEHERDQIPPTDSMVVSKEWTKIVKKSSEDQGASLEPSEDVEKLRKKIHNQEKIIKELKTVNQKWDDHCKNMKSTHDDNMAAQQRELVDLQRRLEVYQEAEDRRQRDIDSLLLNSKRRLEQEQNAKEEALQGEYMERQRREEAERNLEIECSRYGQLEERVHVLEAELHATRDQLKSAEVAHRMNREVSIPGSSSIEPSLVAMNKQELLTEITVLRQQVTIYQSDFEIERRDRERAQTEIDTMKTQIDQLNLDWNTAQQQVNRKSEEIRIIKEEVQRLKRELTYKADEIRLLHSRLQSIPSSYAYGGPNYDPYLYPQPHFGEHTNALSATMPAPIVPPPPPPAQPKWPCRRCTYENKAERTYCELCGSRKDLGTRSSPVSHHGRLLPRAVEQCDTLPQGNQGGTYPRLSHLSTQDDLEIDNHSNNQWQN